MQAVSTAFAKTRAPDFRWQSGYGAFAVEWDRLEQVAAYVRNQEQHHRKTGYQDEVRTLMKQHGLALSEDYFWD